MRPNEEPQQLELRGSLLGIFEKAEYVQETVQLQAGDKLLLYSDGAEPFVGSFDESVGFNFSEAFYKIKDVHVVEMMDKFNTLAQNQEIDPSEVDDITAVAVEVL